MFSSISCTSYYFPSSSPPQKSPLSSPFFLLFKHFLYHSPFPTLSLIICLYSIPTSPFPSSPPSLPFSPSLADLLLPSSLCFPPQKVVINYHQKFEAAKLVCFGPRLKCFYFTIFVLYLQPFLCEFANVQCFIYANSVMFFLHLYYFPFRSHQ